MMRIRLKRHRASSLSSVVELTGGRVFTTVQIHELLFEDVDEQQNPQSGEAGSEEPEAPRCIGVQLAGGQELRFSVEDYDREPVIISMLGFLNTFIRLLPDDVRTKYKVPRGLPALSERRPVFRILFALNGDADELDVTGADYYRLPGAALALDELDESGAIKLGEVGRSGEEPSEEQDGDHIEVVLPSSEKRKKGRKLKFDTGKSWIHISFPSAKDPTFADRHGNITTCVVTIEADDDFVTPFDTKPRLIVIDKQTSSSSGDLSRLLERVKSDLFDIYPQLEDKVLHAEIRGPFAKGLSHIPERYAAKGVRADSPYPGLYLGGSDLTVGDSFAGSIVGGWLVANAVAGYSAIDYLFLGKNITADLAELTISPEGEEVAVPFSSQKL